MAHKIKTEKFEGPLDALLDLIEEKKLSINEVALADVANQYLEYVRGLPELPMDAVSSFLVIASTLMLIKSRSLLPALELTEEEEESIEDLERRLELFGEIRRLSRGIQNLYKKNTRLFSRDVLVGMDFGFFAPERLRVDDIYKSIKALIQELPFDEVLPEKIVERIVSLEDTMQSLIKRAQNTLTFEFRDTTKARDRLDVVINFLALLELVKQGLLAAEQNKIFGSINISKHESTA